MKKAENDMLPEDILSDQNIAPGDRIIITDESSVNTVTTRERIKVFNAGNVYELAVKQITFKQTNCFIFSVFDF